MNQPIFGTVTASVDPVSQGQTIKLDAPHPTWGDTMTLYGWDRASGAQVGERVVLRYQTSSTFGRWKATRAPGYFYDDLGRYSRTFPTLLDAMKAAEERGVLGRAAFFGPDADDQGNGLTEDERDMLERAQDSGRVEP